MTQNFIRIFMGNDLAFVFVDNDIIVGRSHLANRVELITPVTLGTDDVMQIFFELANGNTTPKRSMVATGSTVTVGNDEHNVFRYDIPQSVLSAITSANAATIKVQFRKATIGEGEGNPVASGTATAGGASTLTDSTKSFATNQFANFVVFIVSGAGAGQKRTIASNTATALTVTVPWTVQPTTTSVYSIRPITTIAQALITSAQVSLALDAAIIPNLEDEVIEIDVFDELSGDINNKLNKDFTALAAKAVPDDNDLLVIDEGSGTNKKVTVATIIAAAVTNVEGLVADVEEVQNFVDQDVSIGSNPAFASPTVTSINFLSGGNTETIDFADAQAVNQTAAHIASTANPHSVTAFQVGLGDVDNTSDQEKPVSTATQTALDAKQATLVSGTNIKSINSASILASGNLDLIPASEKAANNGVATLGADGKIPAGQLPSFVDDLEEYANLAAFPVTGETDKIFVALDTGKIYRWSGSVYVEIAANEVNSVNSKTGVVTLDKTDIGLGNVANTAQVTAVTATAPIESSGGTTPVISIVAATDAVAGSMSATDKAKLDALAASTLDTDTTNFGGILSATEDTVQKALDVLDDHNHVVADITDLNAATVTYDNTGQNLVATDVQAAINEIDDLVEEGLTQVVVVKYTITDADDGSGGFVYNRNAETGITGTITADKYLFTLPSGIEYVTGGNRLVTKIDASGGELKRLFYGADSELTEPSTTTFAVEFPPVGGQGGANGFEDNDVLYAKLYQSLATVSIAIADGAVTEAKLASDAVTTVKIDDNAVTVAKLQEIATNTILGNDTGGTANVKALTASETKVLLALNNVDNTTDLNKPISTNTQTALDAKVAGPASAVNNRVATFDSTTGKLIKDSGFTIETSVPAGAVFTDTGEVNLIEIVQAEGTPLSISSKTVNVTRASLGAGTGDADVDYYTTTIIGSDGSTNWVQATTGDWEDAYIATKTVSGILATDKPLIDLDLSGATFLTFEALQTDYALIFRVEASDTNELKFYASDEPVEDLVIQIKVVR